MPRLTMARVGWWHAAAYACALLAALTPRSARSQQLPVKTALSATGPSGCATLGAPVAAPSASDEAAARQLMSDGQEAALQGDHAAARDAFVKAAARAPAN